MASDESMQEAREELAQRLHRSECGCDERSYECDRWWSADMRVANVLSARPEVLAAAMGGEMREFGVRDDRPLPGRVMIVLPPQEET